MGTPPPALHLRASLADRALVVASPLLLVLLGGYGLARGGVSSPGTWVLVVGVVLGTGAALTVPWSSVVTDAGVGRRTLARRQWVPWSEVAAVERQGRRAGSGGLAVRTLAGRRLVLSTSSERPDQWDRLGELVRTHAPGVAIPNPPESHPFARRGSPP